MSCAYPTNDTVYTKRLPGADEFCSNFLRKHIFCHFILFMIPRLAAARREIQQMRFPGTIITERMELYPYIADREVVVSRVFGRDYAFCAMVHLYSGDISKAKLWAKKAISVNPECTDAYLVQLLLLTQVADGETVLCGLRELLGRSEEMTAFYMNKKHRCFYQIPRTRPYLRILMAIGCVAYATNRIDLATQTYEAVMGVNGTDAQNARHPLVSCYLILIGLVRKGQHVSLQRNCSHLAKLLKLQYDGQSVFDADTREPMKRWAAIFMSYLRKGPDDHWKRLVQDEWSLSKETVTAILDPVHVEKNPIPMVLFDRDGRLFREDMILASEYYGSQKTYPMLSGMFPSIVDFTTVDYLKRAIKEWPDMASDMRTLLRLEYRAENRGSLSKNEVPDDDVMKNEDCHHEIEELINESWTAIHEGRYRDGLDACTKAKQIVLGMIPTTERWYKHASFVIASNRATCAALLEEWELARLDSMITLMMKPDHIRTYERLPRIASAMFCPRLADYLRKFVDRVKSSPSLDDESWRKFAKMGVAFLSLDVMWGSRTKQNWYDIFIDDFSSNPPWKLGIEDELFDKHVYSRKVARLPYLSRDDVKSTDQDAVYGLPNDSRYALSGFVNDRRQRYLFYNAQEDGIWRMYGMEHDCLI